MMLFGSDLDGVISLLPFNCKQAILNQMNENRFYSLQEYWPLQKIYNFLIRKPNPEIRKLMEELKKIGVRSVIISASNVNYREELERWLIQAGFYYFEALILKADFKEDIITYKKRIVPANCDFYLDDNKEIVRAINDSSEGKCRAVLYQGQTSKELLKEFFPVFV